MDQITPGMTYGLTALTLAIYSIPLLFVIWRLTKTSIRVRTRYLVFLGALGFLFLMPWIDALIPDNLILALAPDYVGRCKNRRVTASSGYSPPSLGSTTTSRGRSARPSKSISGSRSSERPDRANSHRNYQSALCYLR